MRLAASFITIRNTIGHHVIGNLSKLMSSYRRKSRAPQGVRNVHNHGPHGLKMPLTGKTKYEEYAVMLQDGMYRWTEYVLAADLEQAAWLAFELSTRRNAVLKNVIKRDDPREE